MVTYSSLFEFGLVSLNGEEYINHRKVVMPLFTPNQLNSYIPVSNDVVNEFLKSSELKLKVNFFDVSHSIRIYSMKSILMNIVKARDIDENVIAEFLHHLEGFVYLSSFYSV